MACFIAAIIGDGHLRKHKLQIVLDGFNKNLINNFKILSQKLFGRDFNVVHWMERGKERYRLTMDSKAIYLLLNEVFEVQSGKKSNIVGIPVQIKNSSLSVKCAFVIGLIVTEGGRRRRGFGMSTSSKKLWFDLIEIFQDIGIKISKDKWIYKKYNKEYYGISFLKSRLVILIDGCKDEEIKNILLNCENFKT